MKKNTIIDLPDTIGEQGREPSKEDFAAISKYIAEHKAKRKKLALAKTKVVRKKKQAA
ncbi:MAG: hypothetical protein KF900_03535 [Bacteroidetes bacterium]|nr:hypothetical protein [Bacteroidota bacterium]